MLWLLCGIWKGLVRVLRGGGEGEVAPHSHLEVQGPQNPRKRKEVFGPRTHRS